MKETLATILLALCAYISPVYEFWLVMLCFVLADFSTGIIASNKKGIPRSPRRFRQCVTKIVSYMSAILLSFILQKTFGLEWLYLYRYVGAFICVIEFISILENLAVITGHPVFLKLIKLIRGKASKNPLTEIINEKNNINTDADTSAGSASNK